MAKILIAIELMKDSISLSEQKDDGSIVGEEILDWKKFHDATLEDIFWVYMEFVIAREAPFPCMGASADERLERAMEKRKKEGCKKFVEKIVQFGLS